MDPTGMQLEIAAGRQRAIVTEAGAGLRSWTDAGAELLDGFDAGEAPTAYRGKVLAPWPNRLRDGRYAFGGGEHRTPITEPERGCALHGLVNWLGWSVLDQARSRVALGTTLFPQPGYPFTVRVEVAYALGEAGLEVALRAVNLGDGPAPFGAGFHPYFRPGRIAATTLVLPAGAAVPLDPERLLPTGPPLPVAGTERDFRAGRAIGDLALNTCFTALERGDDGLARIRLAGPERALELWMDHAFGYAMVYTADQDPDPARRRGSVAIEPMTCAPDAFNTGAGLRVLEPGGTLEGQWGCRAT